MAGVLSMAPLLLALHAKRYKLSRMSWASRRKTGYLIGVFLFFAIPASVAGFLWWYQAPTCFDGVLNQAEFSIDRGGPCVLLDERALTPYSIIWTRPFMVRDGLASATVYIENPNASAGVMNAPYRVRLYDDNNVLVGEREGNTPIMPGAITPVFEGGIPTGSRTASRAFFEFIDPLVWERLTDRSVLIEVRNRRAEKPDVAPRVVAEVINRHSSGFENLTLVATVFDAAGNAFASSQTVIPYFEGKERREVMFTWPTPFPRAVARVDVLPVITPLY